MLTIGQFSKIAQVTTKSLRYYDQIGLLKPAYLAKENGYRYYSTSQLEEVLFIQRLKEYDFSLNEIKAVIANSQLLKPLIEKKIYETAQLMQKYSYLLTRMKTDINNLTKGGNFMLNARDFVVEVVDNQKMNIFSIRKKMNVKLWECSW